MADACALVWTWPGDVIHECRLIEGHDYGCGCACGAGFQTWMHGSAVIFGKGYEARQTAMAAIEYMRQQELIRRRVAIAAPKNGKG